MANDFLKQRLDQGLSADGGGSLNALKYAAKKNDPESAKLAAKQFEGVFVQMMMKSMRESLPKEGLFSSSAGDMYQSMLDQQLTQQLSNRGIGMQAVLQRQIEQLQTGKSSTKSTIEQPQFLPLKPSGLTQTNTSTHLLDKTAMPLNQDRLRAANIKIQAYQEMLNKKTLDSSPEMIPSPQAKLAQQTVLMTPTVTKNAFNQMQQPPMQTFANQGGFAQQQLDNNQSQRVNFSGSAVSENTRPSKKMPKAAQNFIENRRQDAEIASQRTGIPANFILGQAGLESGWGKHQPRFANGEPSYNLFGIKAGKNWTGKVVESATTEYINGQPKRLVQRFRAYDSYADAFADHARLLQKNARYAKAINNTQSPEKYAQEMKNAGYATDPKYAQKLTSAIYKAQQMQQSVQIAQKN